MKVAIVVNSSWAAYNFRLNLAKSIKNDGHEVVFIIPFDDVYSKKIQENFECHDIRINAKSINPIIDLMLLASLFLIYKRIKPNLVCHFTIKLNIYGSIAARFCKILNIANITGLGTAFINKSLLTFLVKLLYKFALLNASKIFFQNREDLAYFLNEQIIIKSKTTLLPG